MQACCTLSVKISVPLCDAGMAVECGAGLHTLPEARKVMSCASLLLASTQTASSQPRSVAKGLLLLALQALANLAWSMAHLGYKQEAVLDAIVNRLLSDVDSMNQRDVADLLSALAMLKHQPVGEAMHAVVQHTIELLQEPGGFSFADGIQAVMLCIVSGSHGFGAMLHVGHPNF